MLLLQGNRQVFLDGQAVDGGFLANLERIWRAERSAVDETPHPIPFRGGWFLYLGYELSREIEPALAQLPAEPGIPVAFATRFDTAIVRDRIAGQAWLVTEDGAGAEERLAGVFEDVRDCPDPVAAPLPAIRVREEDPALYLERVGRPPFASGPSRRLG
ncbi:MAG: hypothetical protein M0039_04885 [Pseudomonadota bacterium]|nr:hypothetical protein [Pseudomonadota bacterium]